MAPAVRIATSALLACAAGCSGTAPEKPELVDVELVIVEVAPSAIFIEGGETITVTTRNGCALEDATLTINDSPVEDLQRPEPDVWTFASPSFGSPCSEPTRTSQALRLTCAKPLDPSTRYSKNFAEGSLTIDPALCPFPTVKSYGPVGDRISALAKASVTFTRDMAPETVTAESFHIVGVAGNVTATSTRTFVFTPQQQLASMTTYTVILRASVTSAAGKPLKTTLKPGGGTPDPLQDSWEFTTRREEQHVEFLNSLATGGGWSEGGGFRNFGLVAPEAPVGASQGGSFKHLSIPRAFTPASDDAE